VKKWFFTTGLIIAIIGISGASISNATTVVWKSDLNGGSFEVGVYKAPSGWWNVSGYFNAGERMWVRCNYGANWSSGPFDQDDTVPVDHVHIWFYIKDPNGSTTEYNTAWTNKGLQGQTLPVFAKAYINTTIYGGGINCSQYPAFVGGTALLNGTYTAIVDSGFDPTPYGGEVGAPAYLGFDRDVKVTLHPYAPLLPAGIGLCGVGTVISVASARSKQKTRKTRNGKTRLSNHSK
jgi:hypothetical protein